MSRLRVLAVALSLLSLEGCALTGGPPLAATPQRPSVSSDTNTTHEGTFELEAGLTAADDDSYDTPLALKYGAGPATELFVGWSPLLHVEGGGLDETGIGDLTLGVRHRLRDATPERASLALQGVAKLPTADDSDGLGSGENDVFVAGIASKAVGELAMTGFVQLDVIGDPGGGADLGTTLAVAAGRPLDAELGLFGELAGSFLPDEDIENVAALIGLAWSPHPDLVFDLAIAAGLTDDASDFRVLIGLTRNLGSRAAARRDQPPTGP